MTCIHPAPGVWICGTPGGLYGRTIRRCPSEDRRRRMVYSYGGYSGDFLTCLGCGDMWDDGVRMERPFQPGWRKKRIAHAKENWDRAISLAEYRDAVYERLFGEEEQS